MLIESGLEHVAVSVTTIALFVDFIAVLTPIIDAHWESCL